VATGLHQVVQQVFGVELLAFEVAIHQPVIFGFLDDRFDQRPTVGLYVGVVRGEFAVHHGTAGVVVLFQAE